MAVASSVTGWVVVKVATGASFVPLIVMVMSCAVAFAVPSETFAL